MRPAKSGNVSLVRIRIFGWIGVIWGAFIVLTGVLNFLRGTVGEGVYAAGQVMGFALGAFMLFAGVKALRDGGSRVKRTGKIEEFARDYTAAWCSQKPERVAAFFADGGALTINGGTPAIGRAAITEAARSFMTAFPDMVVAMDRLDVDAGRTEYHWTLTGTNTGPGGGGKRVRISGFEEWLLGDDGLIVDSQGHFDQADYDRQLQG